MPWQYITQGPNALYFPTAGCWRVVAHVGLRQRFEFTVSVVALP